jgi:hypothetical protein
MPIEDGTYPTRWNSQIDVVRYIKMSLVWKRLDISNTPGTSRTFLWQTPWHCVQSLKNTSRLAKRVMCLSLNPKVICPVSETIAGPVVARGSLDQAQSSERLPRGRSQTVICSSLASVSLVQKPIICAGLLVTCMVRKTGSGCGDCSGN